MKSEKLIELMRRPETIGKDDLRELDDLVSRYPYFQTARILYLKALYLKAGGRFRNELKLSTVHITDHKQLFRYLNEQIRFEQDSPHSMRSDLSDIVDERIREISGHIVVNTQGIPAYPQNEPVQEDEDNEIAQLNLQYPTKDVVSIRNTEKSGVLARPATPDTEIVSNPIRLDDIPGVINDYSEGKSALPDYEVIRHSGSSPYVIETVDSNDLTDLSAIPGIISEERPAATVPGSSPVLSMNLDLEDDISFISEETPPPFETPEISSGAYRLSDQKTTGIPDLSGTREKKTGRKNQKKKDELIEQFILADPAMPKITASITEQRDLSRENPFSGEELFSETLAKIYVRQRLYEKAVSTYIKLSLKYPEKSVYFANRIEKIKQNINNKE